MIEFVYVYTLDPPIIRFSCHLFELFSLPLRLVCQALRGINHHRLLRIVSSILLGSSISSYSILTSLTHTKGIDNDKKETSLFRTFGAEQGPRVVSRKNRLAPRLLELFPTRTVYESCRLFSLSITVKCCASLPRAGFLASWPCCLRSNFSFIDRSFVHI